MWSHMLWVILIWYKDRQRRVFNNSGSSMGHPCTPKVLSPLHFNFVTETATSFSILQSRLFAHGPCYLRNKQLAFQFCSYKCHITLDFYCIGWREVQFAWTMVYGYHLLPLPIYYFYFLLINQGGPLSFTVNPETLIR